MHNMSGAVFNLSVLSELLPDYKAKGARSALKSAGTALARLRAAGRTSYGLRLPWRERLQATPVPRAAPLPLSTDVGWSGGSATVPRTWC